MGMPNELCVHWAMDSPMVAEKFDFIVQLPLPSPELHCPVDPSVGNFLFKPVLEVKSMEGSPSHSV
jgi:hypothetical protein